MGLPAVNIFGTLSDAKAFVQSKKGQSKLIILCRIINKPLRDMMDRL